MFAMRLTIAAVLFLSFYSCIAGQTALKISIVNTSHLDSLYEEINIDGKAKGIIHIYSDFPDYKWTGDNDEGIACVDDASRAAIFYMKNYLAKKDTESLIKSEMLIDFLLFMQSENGFFYNFIFKDHAINKTHKNSINDSGWWSWRAMWALSEGYLIMKKVDPELAGQILSALVKSAEAAKKSFPSEKIIKVTDGIEFPAWLPSGTASDQASDLVLALLNYFEETNDTTIISCLNNLCDGILIMQRGTPLKFPFNAFMSWQNIWHAYGNTQSYALLKASEILHRTDLRKAALNEINFFYDYLIDQNYLSSFTIQANDDSFNLTEKTKFPQIAYNFRPMIYACLEAFKLTGDSAYVSRAVRISGWFLGFNVSGRQIYDPSSGICFDGINSENDVNRNSGAESTIEALLSMQMLEQFGLTEEDIMKNNSGYKK